MTEREALEQGLTYTGISFRYWDTEKAEHYKKLIAERKAAYKCRVVKVKERNGFVSYYGDKNFQLVHYDTIETTEAMIKNMDLARERALAEYQKALADIDAREAELKTRLENIKAIAK